MDRDTLTPEKFGDYKTDMTKSYAVAGDGTVTVDSIYEGKEGFMLGVLQKITEHIL